MDKKLTDSEIVKALECCVRFKQICPETCPMVNVRQCKVDLRKNTLALINRQKAEIERLKEEYNRLLNSELQQYEKEYNTGYDDSRKTAKAEAYKECIEKVKKELSFGKHITTEQLDNLVKEMVGENNATT